LDLIAVPDAQVSAAVRFIQSTLVVPSAWLMFWTK
jgi:hypothetical protein